MDFSKAGIRFLPGEPVTILSSVVVASRIRMETNRDKYRGYLT